MARITLSRNIVKLCSLRTAVSLLILSGFLSATPVRALDVAPINVSGSTEPKKLGIYDSKTVLLKWNKAKTFTTEVHQAYGDLRKFVSDANDKYAKLESSGSSKEELATFQAETQKQINDKTQIARDKAQKLDAELDSDLRAALATEAKIRGIDVVVVKAANPIMQPGITPTDLTETTIARLNMPNASPTTGVQTGIGSLRFGFFDRTAVYQQWKTARSATDGLKKSMKKLSDYAQEMKKQRDSAFQKKTSKEEIVKIEKKLDQGWSELVKEHNDKLGAERAKLNKAFDDAVLVVEQKQKLPFVQAKGKKPLKAPNAIDITPAIVEQLNSQPISSSTGKTSNSANNPTEQTAGSTSIH